MAPTETGTQNRIFDTLPDAVQGAIVAYANESKLSPQSVIEFAITYFLELDPTLDDNRQQPVDDGSILTELPVPLQNKIRQYSNQTEMPPEFVVELAIAHFLDPDSATFDDCQVGLQRERVELLKLHHDDCQATAA